MSLNPPGKPLSIDSTLGADPELFDATVAEVTLKPPKLILRKVDSGEDVPVSFEGVQSFMLTPEGPWDWKLEVNFMNDGGWILFTTKER